MNSFGALVEDIMTPRSLLKTVRAEQIDAAKGIATSNDFDIIPISDGANISAFWNRADGRTHPVAKRHIAPHDWPIEWALPRLVRHVVQFVSYHGQIVGLVDLSDLNRPIARLVVGYPLLQLEQTVLMAARSRGITDAEAASALGPKVARSASRLRAKAHRENLDAPLLEFAYLPDLLKACAKLGILSASEDDIDKLNSVRIRTFHPAHRLVENQSDGDSLVCALRACERILATVAGGDPPIANPS